MEKVYFTVGKIFVTAVVGRAASMTVQKVVDTSSTIIKEHKKKKANKILNETMNELTVIEESLSLQGGTV